MNWPMYVTGMAVTIGSASALAQQPAELGVDQKIYIAYHYCMLQAAMKSSHEASRGEEIYDRAHQGCATVRAQAAAHLAQFPELATALDTADAEKKANFPSWIKGVRERRGTIAGSAPAQR